MLLADASELSAWTVAMALIASLSAFGSSYLNYRQSRDSKEFSAKRIKMQAQLQALEEKHADCEKQHAEVRAELTLLRQRMEAHGIDCSPHQKR